MKEGIVMIFSFSRLSLFDACKFKWFLRYVLKVAEKDVLPLALGKAVHRAIELKMFGSDDKEALLGGWREAEFYPFDLKEYQQLYNRAPVLKGEANQEGVEVEKHFVLPLDGKDSPRVQGFIDEIRRPFGELEFKDWKTNRVMYEPTDTMQLALYAWALSQMYDDVEEISGTLFFLRFRKNNVKRFVFNRKHMERARLWALYTAKSIEASLDAVKADPDAVSDYFPATPCKECSTCSFAAICTEKYPKIEKERFIS